jgi:hypothetical protein
MPLNVSQSSRFAVIGAPSIEPIYAGGGTSGDSQYTHRRYESIPKVYPSHSNVHSSRGIRPHRTIPILLPSQIRAKNGNPGIDLIFWNDGDAQPIIVETQESAQMIMFGELKPGLCEKGFRYKMSTTLTSEMTGMHTIAIQCTGHFKLFVDGEEVYASLFQFPDNQLTSVGPRRASPGNLDRGFFTQAPYL